MKKCTTCPMHDALKGAIEATRTIGEQRERHIQELRAHLATMSRLYGAPEPHEISKHYQLILN